MIDMKKDNIKVIIFNTARDEIVEKCFELNYSNQIVCLVQPSKEQLYKNKYKGVDLINIEKERFEDLPEHVIRRINSEKYDKVYLPVAGKMIRNFGNVLEVLKKVRFKRAYFFYADGSTKEMLICNRLLDGVIDLVIRVLDCFV